MRRSSKPMLRLLYDENIPYIREAFKGIASLRSLPGFAITHASLSDTDILLVRSVTKVDAALLEGTPVRFVGSATIGTDHIDLKYLDAKNIAFAHAPGSNAESVAEYVIAGLLEVAVRRGEPLRGKKIGIIGCGNTGGLLVRRLPQLGMTVLPCDPPLERLAETRQELHEYLPFEHVLQEADIITLHVPLTREGADATFNLLGERALSMLKAGAWLINTSRGAVVDEAALRKRADRGTFGGLILDVWQNEPDISLQTLRAADLATPHIAGYSRDGKILGTVMVYQEAVKHLGLPEQWPYEELLNTKHPSLLRAPDGSLSEPAWLDFIVKQMYNIAQDDLRMRELWRDSSNTGTLFNALRKNYPERRSFHRFSLVCRDVPVELVNAVESGLGLTMIRAHVR